MFHADENGVARAPQPMDGIERFGRREAVRHVREVVVRRALLVSRELQCHRAGPRPPLDGGSGAEIGCASMMDAMDAARRFRDKEEWEDEPTAHRRGTVVRARTAGERVNMPCQAWSQRKKAYVRASCVLDVCVRKILGSKGVARQVILALVITATSASALVPSALVLSTTSLSAVKPQQSASWTTVRRAEEEAAAADAAQPAEEENAGTRGFSRAADFKHDHRALFFLDSRGRRGLGGEGE